MTNKEKETQDVIVRLLTNIGSRKEVEQYLRHYASVDAPKFAVVKVSGAIIDRSLDALASSMSFLQRVGLIPIVVHGGNVQLDRALAQAGVDAPVVKGLRKMTPAALEIARRVLYDTNLRLVEALENLETRARPFTSGVLDAKKIESAELGLIGEITNVRDAAIAQTARAGVLPIVAPLGETAKGQIVVVHADAAARAIALALKPHKVVFLSEAGGLVDGAGAVRSAVNLAEDLEEIERDPSVGPESRRKILEINALLNELPPTSSVSITSPEHLAKELFTHGGEGTFVRRGEKVVRHDDWSSIDLDRLRKLLEECFGRRLDARYFEEKTPHRVYLAESYRATAILTMEHGVAYLDKFAVTNEAQGEGIGGSIWQRLRRETPKLFWRSRANNPVNAWYAQKADGLYKSKKWWVFWCGMDDFSEIQRSVECALAMQATFHDFPSTSDMPAVKVASVPPPPAEALSATEAPGPGTSSPSSSSSPPPRASAATASTASASSTNPPSTASASSTNPPSTASASSTNPPSTASASSTNPPSTASASSTNPPSTASASSTNPPSTASASSTNPPSTASASSTNPPSTASASSTNPPSTASAPSTNPPSTASASSTNPASTASAPRPAITSTSSTTSTASSAASNVTSRSPLV